jgi:anti-anti-sigma factor
MSDNERLRIVARNGVDRLILELDGELDMASSDALEGALARANCEESSAVVLDLRGLSFLDSTGLKAIFKARKAVRARGQQFAVTPGSAQVQRLLTLTRLDEHLRMIDSPDALLA